MTHPPTQKYALDFGTMKDNENILRLIEDRVSCRAILILVRSKNTEKFGVPFFNY